MQVAPVKKMISPQIGPDRKKGRKLISKSESSSSFERSEDGHERLEHIFDVSKCLAHFESLEDSFPEALLIAGRALPIVSAVIIDRAAGRTQKLVWLTKVLSDEQIREATSRARASFSYLARASSDEKEQLQIQPEIVTVPLEPSFVNLENDSETAHHFLTFPLVVGLDSIFGILQFELGRRVNEEDLKFANIFANLIALALDRSHQIAYDRLAAKASEEHVRSERDDSQRSVSRLEEERSLREQFVHCLSHDLRTPLASINMTAQLLKRSKSLLPDEQDLVKMLLINSKRLGHMIDSLLDANRLRAGEKLPLHIEECDLVQIISQTVRELNLLTQGRIVFRCLEKVAGYWDSDALRRLTENLIGNAVKYGGERSTISLDLRNKISGPQLTFHNEGNPISCEDQKTLFHPFRRSASAERSKQAGWGIGLTLVRGIAEGHGGKVWVESSEARGTDFYVEIPYDSRPFQASMS